MKIIMLIIIIFIIFEAAGQDWTMYWHNPGPAEYLASFIITGGIIAGVLGLFKKL